MDIVVSGIRPTGKLHLGNYFGAAVNFLRLQEDHSCYFFIADYHSLTTHRNPEELSSNARRVLAEYIALGLDPEKCTLYIQSDLPQTAELYLFLNMYAYDGELHKVASFKEKARSHPDNVNAGLLTYPVLMAADILIHKGTRVPVGKDQEQHLEMTRNFANRFNHIFKTDYFGEPQAFNFSNKLVKVPGLTGQGKMSKSLGEADCIYLNDPADVLQKKIMRARTDSGPATPGAAKSQEVQSLFELMELVSAGDVLSHFDAEHAKGQIRYGDMKKQLAEDMEKFIGPLRERINDTQKNEALLTKAAKTGAEKARVSADKTMREVREIIGFR